jgi:hypothetical protein
VTGASIAKIVGSAIVGAGAALGVLRSGGHVEARAEQSSAITSQVAPSTLSAPALTTADLVAVRDEMRQLRKDVSSDIAGIREDLRELRKSK